LCRLFFWKSLPQDVNRPAAFVVATIGGFPTGSVVGAGPSSWNVQRPANISSSAVL
jgi:hypothetical protein